MARRYHEALEFNRDCEWRDGYQHPERKAKVRAEIKPAHSDSERRGLER